MFVTCGRGGGSGGPGPPAGAPGVTVSEGNAVCDGLLSTHHSLTLPWLLPSSVQAIEFVDATVPTVGSDARLFN